MVEVPAFDVATSWIGNVGEEQRAEMHAADIEPFYFGRGPTDKEEIIHEEFFFIALLLWHPTVFDSDCSSE